MGLQNNLTDVSSESIPILLVGIIANCVAYLRASLFTVLHSVGLSRFGPDDVVGNDGLYDAVGTGLADLIVLADQLNLSRVSSYRCGDEDSAAGSDCVVCLNRLSGGDRVRMLACRHVFHKECFDGWLDHLNFSCPLCRSPVVSDERVAITRRRVSGDVQAWFSLR